MINQSILGQNGSRLDLREAHGGRGPAAAGSSSAGVTFRLSLRFPVKSRGAFLIEKDPATGVKAVADGCHSMRASLWPLFNLERETGSGIINDYKQTGSIPALFQRNPCITIHDMVAGKLAHMGHFGLHKTNINFTI